MSLTILYSDRVDDLAADLKRRLLARRAAGADPFDFVPVAVPNRNLEKWLRVRALSDAPELAAGVAFPFLDSFVAEEMRANLPPGPRPRLLSADRLRNEIARLLVRGGDADLDPLRRYAEPDAAPDRPLASATDESARKLWQLSDRLAALSGEYDLRRPRMVEGWLDGSAPVPAAGVERAERALARALFGPGGPFPGGAGAREISLRQLFALVRGRPPAGPARTLFVFGHSSLSPLHAQILHWLARTHEVVFHHLTVCLEYWGDVRAPWERAKAAAGGGLPPEEDLSCENELLSAWGRAGRETMRLLVDLEEENRDVALRIDPVAPAPDGRPETVLSVLQSSVRRRTSELPRRAQDASVQLVSSQSVRREAETVYNAILGAVWKPAGAGARPWPDCSFSDIAVLVPDMAAYRPAIEEVFDGRGQIPYGLVDATAAQDSALLRGLLSLLRLAASGLGRAELFDVLANPCAQRALRFSPEDLRSWRDRTEEIGAFRGFDEADAEALGLADAGNATWDYALSRLRLAGVADEAAGPDGAPLPLPGRPDGDDLRLSEIVEELHRALSPLRSAALPCVAPFAGDGAPPSCWAEAVTRLLDRFLAAPPDDRLEAQVRSAIPSAVFALGDFGARRLPFVAQCVEQFVGALPSRRGGYLTSGVTIASLQPMRPVPFRQVFVLGLNEGRFPGSVSDSTLDLRGLGRAVGDARMPDINRFLFLETLMATRDRLVLSWVSKNLRKDEDLFPCSLVRDLARFAGAHVLPPSPDGRPATLEAAATPLLESDVRSTRALDWRADDAFAGLLPTYHDKSREAALLRAGLEPFPEPPDAPRTGAQAASALPDATETAEIRLRDLALFLKDPLDATLSRRFRIEKKGWQDRALPDDQALSLGRGPDLWNAQGALVDFWLSAETEPDEAAFAEAARREFDALRRRGAVPDGFLGDYERGRSLGNPKTARAYLEILSRTGLRRGGPRTPEPLRPILPLDLAGPDGRTVRAELSGSVEDWFPPDADEPAGTALVVRYFRPENDLPPSPAIEPLLVWLAARAAGGPAMPLRVALVNFNASVKLPPFAAWRWDPVDPGAARGFLARLAEDWLSFAASADREGRVVSVGWDALAAAFAGPAEDPVHPPKPGERVVAADWDATLAALLEPSGGRFGGGSGSELAVESLADSFVRDPVSAEDVRALAERRFAPLFDATPE